jgi:hypothetical protein
MILYDYSIYCTVAPICAQQLHTVCTVARGRKPTHITRTVRTYICTYISYTTVHVYMCSTKYSGHLVVRVYRMPSNRSCWIWFLPFWWWDVWHLWRVPLRCPLGRIRANNRHCESRKSLCVLPWNKTLTGLIRMIEKKWYVSKNWVENLSHIVASNNSFFLMLVNYDCKCHGSH